MAVKKPAVSSCFHGFAWKQEFAGGTARRAEVRSGDVAGDLNDN